MPPEKQKVDKAKRLVEVDAELVEDAAVPAVGIETDNQPFVSLAPETITEEVRNAPLPPGVALKNTVLKALPFVLISLALFALPFFMSDFNVLWLKYSQVRTYMLCALIWNLIGACLYAQVENRNQKILIFLIFALPLITSHHWASFMYIIEMSLRSIFNAPL